MQRGKGHIVRTNINMDLTNINIKLILPSALIGPIIPERIKKKEETIKEWKVVEETIAGGTNHRPSPLLKITQLVCQLICCVLAMMHGVSGCGLPCWLVGRWGGS